MDVPHRIGAPARGNRRLALATGLPGPEAIPAAAGAGATLTTITSLTMGGSPTGMAIDEQTHRLYVARGGSIGASSGSVGVFDGRTHAPLATVTLPTGSSAVRLAVNDRTNRVYVTDALNARVHVINGATSGLVGRPIAVGAVPIGVAVNPVTNRVYIVNARANTISVINGQNNTVVATLAMPAGLPIGLGIAVDPATNRVYAVSLKGVVVVLDGATHRFVGAPIPVGATPGEVAVNATTGRVYVANRGADTLSVIDGASGLVAATIPLGQTPDLLAVDSSANVVHVLLAQSATTTRIDGTTNRAVGVSAPLGAAVTSLVASPATGRVYASQFDLGRVLALAPATALAVAVGPTGVALNE